MNTESQVLLRIRVVKMRAPERMGSMGVRIIAGDRVVKLSNTRSEWAIFYLKSWDELISFQVAPWNASCLCREIEGTKRIDFTKSVCILVEGYAINYRESHAEICVEMGNTSNVTENCHILYPSVNADKRLDGYHIEDVVIPVMVAVEGGLDKPHLHVVPPSVPTTLVPSPVDIALEWMNFAYDKPKTITASKRSEYIAPSSVRAVWDPSMTRMGPSAHVSTDLSRLQRAIDFSENLTKAYML